MEAFIVYIEVIQKYIHVGVVITMRPSAVAGV